jgi:hypothetical protein
MIVTSTFDSGRVAAAQKTEDMAELFGYFGVLASLIAVAAVAVLGQSGFAGQPVTSRLAAVAATTGE